MYLAKSKTQHNTKSHKPLIVKDRPKRRYLTPCSTRRDVDASIPVQAPGRAHDRREVDIIAIGALLNHS